MAGGRILLSLKRLITEYGIKRSKDPMKLFLICLVFCLASLRPVWAQNPEPVRVIIAPFTDSSGSENGELARIAEETLRAELLSGKQYSPLPNNEVVRAAVHVGRNHPFAVHSLKLLSHELGASLVVIGEVASMKTDK